MEQLQSDGYSITGYFCNPNIHPVEEYMSRLSVAKEVSRLLNFELLEGPYDSRQWFEMLSGFADESEGKKRCAGCFRMRLEVTWKKALESGIPFFTTTMTVSPHKNAAIINPIGKEIGGRSFLERDFKKKDGFKKTINFAKKHKLYRQDYCGCEYSKRKGENES